MPSAALERTRQSASLPSAAPEVATSTSTGTAVPGGTASVPSAALERTRQSASLPSAAPEVATSTSTGTAVPGGTASVPSAALERTRQSASLPSAAPEVATSTSTGTAVLGGTASVPSAALERTRQSASLPSAAPEVATSTSTGTAVLGGTASVPSAVSARTRQSASLPLPVRKWPSKNSVLMPQDFRSVVLFVTVNAHRRQAVFANGEAVSCILSSWRRARNWLVGRYVIMPDHVHFFCAPGSSPVPDFHRWMAYWKSLVARTFPCVHDLPLWQRECWDVQMRTVEDYREKWTYVRNNPVRKGFVVDADEWPYQGVENVLTWHD